MNRTSLSFRATWRTRSRSLDTPSPALRPGRVSLAVFPSGRPLPSTASAPGSPGLFGSFAGSTGLSDFPWSCIKGLPPQRSPHGPPSADLPPREPSRTGHHRHPRATTVGSPGGISPPGSHGSRRDSLPSPGSSHQPSVVADQAPVNEERGLPAHQPRPPAVKPLGAPQSLVLLRSPAPQVGADTL